MPRSTAPRTPSSSARCSLSGVSTRQTPAQKQVREARRDVHRQHLVDAAERVFAERGYEGTRMQDVAAEAGLALATVYSLVDSKEALYAEVHRVRGRALLAAAASAAGGRGSAWATLLGAVRAYAEFLVERPNYLRLHLQESQPWALRPRFTSHEQSSLWKQGLDLTVATFEAAIAEGSIIAESPMLLARLMIADHQVFLGEWVDQGMKEPPSSLVTRMLAHLERAFAVR